MIQISYPLAQFQTSFASLLQEAKIAPPPPPFFLLMYATADVFFTCSLVLFLQKAFKQKKTACNSKPSELASEKSVRSKGGSLMGAKASKAFLIHHFNLFAASSEI